MSAIVLLYLWLEFCKFMAFMAIAAVAMLLVWHFTRDDDVHMR